MLYDALLQQPTQQSFTHVRSYFTLNLHSFTALEAYKIAVGNQKGTFTVQIHDAESLIQQHFIIVEL